MKPDAVVLASQQSPTGQPVLPRNLVPVALAMVVAAGVVKRALPPGTIYAVACEVVQELGIAFGIISQGFRR